MKATDQIEFKALNKAFDKLKEFDSRHGWIDYFIAPVIVTIIVLVVYAIKGVYPFGVNTVAYYDMPTNGMAGYSWIYDVLHGKTGLFLEWNTGLGISMATGGSEFFPINWFFFFVSRDSILYAFSFFLLIKLELVAFSMSFYTKKRFNSTLLTVCSGVLYTFCGYVLQYYTNIDFIDFVYMLPFLVYALEKLLIEHKKNLFIILMFFVFLCNIQIVFMVCIYLVFKSYFILNEVSQDKKGKSIRLFVLSSIIALAITGFVFVPEVLTLLTSVRVTKGINGSSEGFDYFEKMKLVYNYFRRQKEFMLYGSEITVALLCLMMLRGKNIIKKYSDNLVMIFILAIPILHEGINLIWHVGSYKHFPLRFGFMITFECLILFARYFTEEEFKSIKYAGRIFKIIGIAAIPFAAYVLFEFFVEFTESAIGDLSPYHAYWLYFLTVSGMYLLIFLMDSKQARALALIIMVLVQGFCGCYGLIAPKTANIEHYRIRYVLNSIDLRNEFGDISNRIERIKMDPADYDPNDSMIIGQPTISYWTYGINSDTEYELQKNMGYDGMSTCVLDSGGTVFTDALLGVKYLASLKKPDNILYTKADGKNNVYDCNYTMPFGLVVEENEIDTDKKDFEYHNLLFKKISGLDSELITYNSADSFVEDVKEMSDDEIEKMNDVYISNGPKDAYIILSNDDSSTKDISDMNNASDENSETDTGDEVESLKKYKLKIQTDDTKVVYINAREDFTNDIMLMVNDNPLYVNSFDSHEFYTYPNSIMNGILTLGSLENNTMELTIYTTNNNLNGIDIGFLDLNILERGIEAIKENQNLNIECGKNSMHVTGVANKTGTLFLPMGYSDNWNAKTKGKSVEVRPYLNNAFTSVDVQKGDVDIEFTYMPKGLISGIILSVMGLICGLIVSVFEKRGGFKGKRFESALDKICIYGFNAIVAFMFIVMYVVPIWMKMSL